MEPPSNYKTAGIMMLVSGIINILASIGLSLFLFVYISMIAVATMGIGILCYACCLWPILPLGFGIFELITGMNVMNGKPVRNASTVAIAGIVMGALNLPLGIGVVPMVMEIIATVMLNDDEVKAWIEESSADLLEV